MKSFYAFCMAFAFISLMLSCNQKPKKTESPEPMEEAVEENSTLDAFDPISKDTFDSWEARWNTNFRSYFATDSLSFFDMPLVDLNAILGETGVDNARFYMGMDSSMVPHLMLVGTNRGVPNFSVIADYTNACPPRCPE